MTGATEDQAPALAAEATPVADATPAPEKAASPQPDAVARLEKAAAVGGWKPLAEFEEAGGDPAKWVDAAEYVLKAAEILPSMKATLDKYKGELREVKTTLKKFGEYNDKAEQRAYERAVAELEARQEQAVADNDPAEVRKITKEIATLSKEVAAPVKDAKPAEPEEVADWKADNPWYAKDAAMRGAAHEIINDLLADNPDASIKSQLKAVDRRIREEFPHKFDNPRRQAASAVEGDGAPPRKGGKTYADLPADAKAMCDDFVKNIKGFTRDKYVRDYQWS